MYLHLLEFHMLLYTRIVLLMIGLSSATLLVCMEKELSQKETNNSNSPKKHTFFLLRRTAESEAERLANFARKSNNDTAIILDIAQWIVRQKDTITEPQQWKKFVDMFVENMEGSYCLKLDLDGNECFCNCRRDQRLEAVIGVVKEITYELQQDYPQLLVNRTQEALSKMQ
jgi:hypothetical protein